MVEQHAQPDATSAHAARESSSTGHELSTPTRGLSSFVLKMVAIVAMTCDHAGLMFWPHLPFEARCVLIGVGGATFPIMAFLLVEGYVHTSNLKRYALRLALFALISEIPFWLFLGHEGNVLFTLLIGLGALWVNDNVEETPVRMVALLALLAISLPCDWGGVGPAMILLFYRGREGLSGVALALGLCVVAGCISVVPNLVKRIVTAGSWNNLPFLLYYLVGNAIAAALICQYNGTRGARPLKWFFYIYYPAHIAVLGAIHLILFSAWPAFMV